MASQHEGETFDQRVARERAENLASREKAYKQLAEAFRLAGFRVEKEERDVSDFNATVYMRAKCDDMFLHAVANDYSLRGRVRIAAFYPPAITGEHPYDNRWPHPQITCSLDKTPAQIAADIMRRIMPLYRDGMVLARAANARISESRSSRNAELRALLGREPNETEQKTGQVHIEGCGPVYGHINVSVGSASFTLCSVPSPVANKIMALLQTCKGADEK